MLPVNRFINFIEKTCLVNYSKPILLAVSGGKDSVLMAYLFKEAGIPFAIAHCNFNLRGDESQRDEAFVRLLANNLDVRLFIKQFDTKTYAEAEKVSTQMAARFLRYKWFDELAKAHDLNFIAVAQHQTDAIETLLINLVRGTGISGLHGIQPVNGKIIRPLLFLSSLEINDLIKENNLSYVEDSSNLTTDYARNKIRHDVIPHLRSLNPSLEKTFSENMLRFAEAEEAVKKVVTDFETNYCLVTENGISIPIENLKNAVPQRLIAFELLKKYGFSASLIEEVVNALNKQTGTSFYSNTHQATINRKDLLVTPITNNLTSLLLHDFQDSVSFKKQILYQEKLSTLPVNYNENTGYIDADKLQYPLLVRSWEDSDKFKPLGMRGFKKISDFFIDLKIPLPYKNQTPLLINGNGDIIWVGGLRVDDRYKITASTKKVVIFELKK